VAGRVIRRRFGDWREPGKPIHRQNWHPEAAQCWWLSLSSSYLPSWQYPRGATACGRMYRDAELKKRRESFFQDGPASDLDTSPGGSQF